mmetsp:Transcript_6943/g.21611  ORF Transcript_6943/g.21611 Transcript_6943/m.21611 type:complete len:222 (+) Transcript_6943:214-879(+)
MASLTGLPSGKEPPPLPLFNPFMAFNSSSTLPVSNILNCSSNASDAVNTPTASASASAANTFSSILSNALNALEVLTPCTISATALFVFALAARAFNVSFFDLASAIFVSNTLVFATNFSTASFCKSKFSFIPSAFSWYDLRLVNASLAKSSSPFSIASCARLYQSSAVFCAELYLFSNCFCDAITCAVACLILIKSPFISFTVWSKIFSGSSAAVMSAFA